MNELKTQSIELRKKGSSYSQIQKTLGVSKSTLSGWLKEYPLGKERIYELKNSENRVAKFVETMSKKRNVRLEIIYQDSRTKLLPLSNRELLISGLFLYWGEGNKGLQGQVSISNSDPALILFALHWLTNALNVPKNKIKALLHIYDDMNYERELDFWRNITSLPRAQFFKPYIKETKKSEVKHKGFAHGTCNLFINDVRLKEKIMMSIKAVSDINNAMI